MLRCLPFRYKYFVVTSCRMAVQPHSTRTAAIVDYSSPCQPFISIMKLFLFPALTLALSGAADAVSCYSSSGGPSCATYNGLWTFHGDYCDHYWTRSSMDYLYFDSASGHQARIRHTGGQFANQQQCLSVTGTYILLYANIRVPSS